MSLSLSSSFYFIGARGEPDGGSRPQKIRGQIRKHGQQVTRGEPRQDVSECNNIKTTSTWIQTAEMEE